MKAPIRALLLLIVWGTLPLSAVKKDTQLILNEIQKLADSLAGLEKKVTALTADLSELNKKVEITADKVAAVATGQADFIQSKENIQLSLQVFKEELTELKNNLSKINERLTNTVPAAGGTPPAGSGGGGDQSETVLNQDPSKTYYAAYSDYIKQNYDLAIEGFQQYLRLFPESGLADNALYWIGMCYYTQKKYTEAINTFNDLINKYKDGDKVPAAMMYKGYTLLATGKQGEGSATLKELISRFPLSEEAQQAQQKLKEITN